VETAFFRLDLVCGHYQVGWGAKEARMNKKPVPETQRIKTDILSETANIAPLDG
jgi:hypothetical protein